MDQAKILIIVGTTRVGRSGRKIADWYLAEAKKVVPANVQLGILDIADYNLPLFNEAMPPMMHHYSEVQNKISEQIAAADGFIVVTGEYNHTIPASLANFLQYINAEWQHKAVAYVSYGTHGGVRAVEHLIQLFAELHVASVATSGDLIAIRLPWEALDDNGIPKQAYVHGNIESQLKELTWWVHALKVART